MEFMQASRLFGGFYLYRLFYFLVNNDFTTILFYQSLDKNKNAFVKKAMPPH
jgi:hypothetical protein